MSPVDLTSPADAADVRGLEQEEACRRLAEAGERVQDIRPTLPPDPASLAARWRVVQQRRGPGGLILIVAQEMRSGDHSTLNHPDP